MDADGMPHDQSDRHVKQVLRRDFEATANSIRASATSLLFARAANTWVSDLTSAEVDIPKETKDEIKKVALASALVVDATLDAFQMGTQAMAYSVAARRNIW